METEPESTRTARAGKRLSWPAAALVIAVLALLAWALVGGVIWSFLR